MSLKDAVKVSRKTFFNPRGWSGYDFIKLQFRTTWDIIKDAVSPQEVGRQETFDEAMKRLELTEEDIQKSQNNYLLFASLFVLCGVLTLVFSFYLIFHHKTFSGMILGFVTSTLFFVYAFRYHFWYFQIKHRKLGCTIDDWLHGKPLDRKEPKP